jgi:phage tail sheath gpL-like
VEDEQMYVVTAGSPNTVVRGYNDTLAAAHTAVTGYSYLSVLGINKAVIDWINTYSARITATRNTAYNAGIPDTLSETYLTGGGEGSISSTDWQDALDAVRTEKYNYISVTSTDLAIHSKLKTHLNDKWGLLGQEAIGHVGLAKDATLSQIRSHTKSLQSSNICLHFQDSNRSDDQGVDTNYAPWAKAVMEAGIQAGSAIGTPLTRKSLDVTALGQNSNIDVTDDSTIETLIEYGVCVARYDGEEYRIIRSLTTWTNNDDAHLIEPGVRTALAWTVYKVRDRVRFRHLGKRALAGNALSIKSTARTTLEEIRDVDEAIVNGNREVGGRIIPIPAFDNIQVSQTGNVAELSYDCTPVNGTDFVKVNTTVVPYQDVA